MICKNCGKDNDLSSNEVSHFCSECGTELVDHQPTKKRKSVRRIFAVIIVLVLAFGAVSYGKLQANPVNRLAMGYARAMNRNKVELKTSMTFEMDNKVLDEIKLVNQMTFYPKDLNADLNMQMYYEEKKAGSIKGSIQNGIGYISSDEFMKDDFIYYEFDDFEDVMNDYQILFDIYKKLSTKGVKWAEYSDAVNKALGRDLKKDFNTITLNIDTDTLVDVMVAIIEVAIDDDDLKECAKDNLSFISRELEDHKRDFEIIEIDKDFLKDLEDFLEDDFDDSYDEIMDSLKDMEDELRDELEYSMSGMGSFTDIEMICELSAFNRIKSITYEYSISDYKVIVKTEFDDGAKKDKFKIEDGLKIEDMDELEDYFSNDFQDYIEDYQKENEVYEKLSKDLEKDGLTDEDSLLDFLIEFDSFLNDL